jgi:hypothetical protein
MKLVQAGLVAAAITMAVPASAATVFSTDFESGLPAEFSGQGSIQAPGTLPAASFGQAHLYNDTTTTGDAGASILTLGGLAAHSSLSLEFDFLAWNSWDGSTQGFPQGDFFEVLLDGNLVASISPNNASGTLFVPGSATLTFGPAPYGFGDSSPFFDRDTVYRVTLAGLAHTSANAVFSFRVNGGGWQGGSDEAFGLDNIRVDAFSAAVPEPSTWAMLILGFGALGASLRQRKARLAFA